MGGPLTPTLTPYDPFDDTDDVPLYFLDEAGIETELLPLPLRMYTLTMGSTFSTLPALAASSKSRLQSALRKPSSPPKHTFKKLVRFLDRVEIVSAPLSFYDQSTPVAEEEVAQGPSKKQKLSVDPGDTRFYPEAEEMDAAIMSGLGRAGSPNRSPNRSPNASTADITHEIVGGYLTPPRTEATPPPPLPASPPPSWRIPPESLFGRQPHVHSPPRVRSPTRADEEINLRVDEHSCDDDGEEEEKEEEVRTLRPGVSYIRRSVSPPKAPRVVMHPVIARKMWPHGETRFEDQWGRRLIRVGQKDSFRFDLWPVEEDVIREGDGGSIRGAWVRSGRFGEAMG